MLVRAPEIRDDLEFEQRLFAGGYTRVAGVDEVGRGSWAGPLVAAAVILPWHDAGALVALTGVCDSKQLAAPRREELFGTILGCALSVGIGWTSHHVIDRDGLAHANRLALRRAVAHLPLQADALLIDHFHLPECPLPQTAITKGDCRSLSIAAASIVAKVTRDRWMTRWDAHVPGYGFALHKGYGTRLHRLALAERGPSGIHRLSFRPLAEPVP
ncbi:MAG: ribonuclease HII [Chloroflexota bacterium]